MRRFSQLSRRSLEVQAKKPPAPAEEVEEPKEGEKPAEVAPAEKKEEQAVPLKDGTIDWAPIERPAEQKAS